MPFRFRSLRARLISRYLVILGIGGLATSIVGSWIVSSTILRETRHSVDRDLAAARMIYAQQVRLIERTVEMAASGRTDPASLEAVRVRSALDFLELVQPGGKAPTGVVAAASVGRTAAGTETLTGPRTGMAIVAAAPLPTGGALYGGIVLNGRHSFVDRIARIVFDAAQPGIVTIFQGEVRIATSLRDAAGAHAEGSRAQPGIGDAVSRAGTWRGRTLAGGTAYIASYEPIRDPAGEAVGMLAVGVQESAYTSIRNGVILSFFAIATAGFFLIIGVSYYMIRSITEPLARMAEAADSIAAGRFDREVTPDGVGEIAQLAESFNTMLKSLRQMKGDLEEWGRTLEEKVRQRTAELGSMQARVAQSERLASLGLLAAGVAHEINNPLGGILALTGLTVEDMKRDDPNRENLEEVLKQAERCRRIVRGLLDFSRQSRAAAEPVDVNRIFEDTLALIAHQPQFFNITVLRDLSPDLPPVLSDKSQLQQVFLNIIMNAVQAMKERGTLTLATGAEDGFVEVRIGDTGPGIPQDDVGRIFDPFFTTKQSGGTGLGLSIAYGIVRQHNGTISVQSEPGRGTTFIVRLPQAR